MAAAPQISQEHGQQRPETPQSEGARKRSFHVRFDGATKRRECGEEKAKDDREESVREKLKRHRMEMAGRVRIPETWEHERLLKDWSDCHAIDRILIPAGLRSAREALIGEFRRASSRSALEI